MDKYCNKYRIASARAQWWDYGWNGAYFITICTRDKHHFFGEIRNGKMVLSPLGVIADVLWHEIPRTRPFVELGDFVVMPNHVHGILILDKPDGLIHSNVPANPNVPNVPNVPPNVPNMPNVPNVETLHATSLHASGEHTPIKNEYMSMISPKSESVSAIIRAYKSAVTKHANRLGLENGWQTRFHDHIIRNDASYQRIADYIVANPLNWEQDRFYN